jgi:hypothetical protein
MLAGLTMAVNNFNLIQPLNMLFPWNFENLLQLLGIELITDNETTRNYKWMTGALQVGFQG